MVHPGYLVSATPDEVHPPSPELEAALPKLHEIFKIRHLRQGQAKIIDSVLGGRDTLAVMPTGSGKSLIYQFPSQVMPGPTIVVSPLLALIEDQVTKMQALGIPVARIDSSRTAKERREDLASVREGRIKLVFITPESITSPAVQNELEGVRFSLFAVDEAHCVSQWGHDFRPSYLGLRRAAEVLGRPPILALTATATPAIADDVLVQLGMKEAEVCRVSFHRPNLAFDVRKVAGEADKLRLLGKMIQRLRRPGIIYCATTRAVDDLYIALKAGKIPVERYHGKMTPSEREKSQASFMQSGRKVVMVATNAFGLGIDKPDIRYIIHYQMPGSPEAYVQEAGRAGRDGKPARCVLFFQPADIDVQEFFLREAHPTKTQARSVAMGLYAWSDEGKEVSVRDLAVSMALPERRVRVVLSVLEGMGVASEVKAARWKGVDPRPTQEQIDKAASIFEARRISDRRRLAELLKYMNQQSCRVQLLREYFGEPEGIRCGLCDSCAGLDSELFDPGAADQRTGLHAATDFQARKRKRKKGKAEGVQAPGTVAPAGGAAARVFATAIPALPEPMPVPQVAVASESEQVLDDSVWDDGGPTPGTPVAGEIVLEPAADGVVWWAEGEPAASDSAPAEANGTLAGTGEAGLDPAEVERSWASVRDAGIRPYNDWLPSPAISLPALPLRPTGHNSGGGGGGAPGGQPRQGGGQDRGGHGQHARGGGHGGGGDRNGRGGRGDRNARRGRRDRNRGGQGGDRGDNGQRGGPPRDAPARNERDRGPRLPGVYNPGGD